jgi:hypothetical protein
MADHPSPTRNGPTATNDSSKPNAGPLEKLPQPKCQPAQRSGSIDLGPADLLDQIDWPTISSA